MSTAHTVAIAHDPAARYGDGTAARLVDAALEAAGCDADRIGTSAWNPFGAFAPAGARIHVLPNWVSNRRGFEPDEHTFFAKVTHADVLAPALKHAIRAAGAADRVSVGNAPIQGCNFARVVDETGTRRLLDALPADQRPQLADLRGLRSEFGAGGTLRSRELTDEPVVEIDLGTDSLLEPLYAGGKRPAFRVADYPGSATEAYHGPGRHVYVMNRRLLDAQLIVSVPKLKAHEKVGLTCALKGTVGGIARKECLAHHRLGSTRQGGDEVSRDIAPARLTSALLEYVSDKPVSAWSNALRVAATTAFRAFRVLAPGTMGGSWSGNDTAWRMALDIARVLRYATPEGRMADTPQRRHIAIIDGVVSGEGDGPLHPRPHDTGVVLFGDDACLVDWACALVMGWPPERIPLVRESFRQKRYPLTEAVPEQLKVVYNGDACPASSLPSRFAPHLPPAGWRAHLGS